MEEIEGLNFAQVIIASMLLVFIFAIAIILFVFIYQRKLMKQKIDYQKLKLSKERELLFNSLKIQEVERKNFASNLHDELGAQLSIAKMTLSSLEYHATSPEKQKEVLANTLDLMNHMADTIRNISYDLLPPSLAQFGLKAATQEFLDKIPQTSLHLIFEANGREDLAEEKQLHLFRIIQESVNNAIKYSQATEIKVLLDYSTKQRLVVKDNGVGFEEDLEKKVGLGILNMKSRAALIQCQLTIESSSEGTTLTVILEQKENEEH